MALRPSTRTRADLAARGGGTAARCYQCATCSAVCELATPELAFPRRQMHLAQWGLGDRLAADPAVWLCHQCNDCTERCPRDAKPGDVMAAVRSVVIETLAVPRFMGRLVANAATTWWLLLGVPIAYWIVLLHTYNGFDIPAGPKFANHDFVPHALIYATYFTVTGLVGLVVAVSALRFWRLLGEGAPRPGSLVSAAVATVVDILTHDRFASCGQAKPRRWGHFFLLWGFIGAAGVSGLIVVLMYGFGTELPLPQTHWVKVLGNLAALSLVAVAALLLVNRLGGDALGKTTAFDVFFFAVVLLVIATGIGTEVFREAGRPVIGCWTYVVHLGAVLCLFGTFPYSKFAHILYRTLAMIHQRMAGTKS